MIPLTAITDPDLQYIITSVINRKLDSIISQTLLDLVGYDTWEQLCRLEHADVDLLAYYNSAQNPIHLLLVQNVLRLLTRYVEKMKNENLEDWREVSNYTKAEFY